MQVLARVLLLLFVAIGLTLPMASGFGTRPGGAQAATRPCPSKAVLEVCVLEAPSGATTPRGTAAPDAPCQGKAIGSVSSDLAVPSASSPLAFDAVSASWFAWSPSTLTPPPRS